MEPTKSALCVLKYASIIRGLKGRTISTNRIECRGHGTKSGGHKVASNIADAIVMLQLRTAGTTQRLSLGLYKVPSRFVPNFARIGSSLSKGLR